MTVKNIISILGDCTLSDVESKLFDINIELIGSKHICVKKAAIKGFYDLLHLHNHRQILRNLSGQSHL